MVSQLQALPREDYEIPGQAHERVLSEKYPLHFCRPEVDADTERSEVEADAEGSMHFFDSAMLLFCELHERFQHRFRQKSFRANFIKRNYPQKFAGFASFAAYLLFSASFASSAVKGGLVVATLEVYEFSH